MAVEKKQFAKGGMDTDHAIQDIAPNDYVTAHNTRVTGFLEGEEGDVTNIEGNTIINSVRPNGINKCVGAYGFELIRKAFTFVLNSQGFNLITEIDYDTLTETTLFENKTDSNGIDILPLNPQKYVTDCKLLQKRYLIFTYGTLPYYVDLTLLRSGNPTPVIQEDLLLIKGQPLTEPIIVYNNDAGRSVNTLKNRLFQFRTQWEKFNFERTTWSTISKRVVPVNEPTPTFGTNVTINNNLIVSVDIGNNRNKRINVAGRYDLLDWFLVKSVERADVVSLPNTTVNVSLQVFEAYDPATNIYSFAFYNDENYQNIEVLETDENYDHIWDARTLELINGSILAIAGLTEGYERPIVDVDISVSSYDPNITVPTIPVDAFRITNTTNVKLPDNPFLGNHRRLITITFAGLPKTGDQAFVQVRDLRNYAIVNNYTYGVVAPQEDNLSAVIASISTQIPNSSVSGNTISFITVDYFELSFARIYLANAGTGASKSIHGIKSNSSYQLALAHYDEFGRYFPIVSDKRFVQKTPSYAQTHGLLSKFDWQINSLPPLNAKTYQWLLSLNLTHETDLFINGLYEAELSTNDYLVFNIKSLKKFNDTNSSSILNYDYSAGDRATFLFTFLDTSAPIKWFDTVAIDVEVVGFEIVVVTTVDPNVTNYLLKVRKSSSLNVSDIIGKEVLLELYSPRKRVISNADGTTTEATTLFFEIGERYNIVNGDYEVKTGSITEGDNYFKTRELTGNINPNTLYNLIVEDFNFSDFYKSDYTSYGRPRSYYDEIGRVEKSAGIRYSDTFVMGSQNNGINRFYGARLYGDNAGETSSVYGFIQKIRLRGSTLICIQELDIWHVPVNISIVEDQAEQRQYAISDKLFNFARPTIGNYGIGDAVESYSESSNGTIYFVDPNNSLPVRDGYDGVKVISVDNTKYFRRVLKQAKKDKRKIIGIYDVFNDEWNISIEIASGVVTTFSFADFDWEFEDAYVIDPDDLVVTANSNGVAVLNGDGTATFTPNTDYIGNAGFTFTFLNGATLVIKNSCGEILAGSTDINPFYFVDLVNQELSTLLVSNSVLISGNTIPSPISVTDGEYSINGGAWTSVSGTVSNGDTVRVRRTSSASNLTTVSARLTVGSYYDDFDIKTKGAFSNVEKSGVATKDNCAEGQAGTEVTYIVSAGTYTASTQLEADNLAQADVDANKQAYANANGSCVFLGEDYFLTLGGSIVGTNVTVTVELKDEANAFVTVATDILVQVQFQFTEISTGDPVTVVPYATILAGTSSIYVYDYDTTAFTLIDQFIMSATPNPVNGHTLIF